MCTKNSVINSPSKSSNIYVPFKKTIFASDNTQNKSLTSNKKTYENIDINIKPFKEIINIKYSFSSRKQIEYLSSNKLITNNNNDHSKYNIYSEVSSLYKSRNLLSATTAINTTNLENKYNNTSNYISNFNTKNLVKILVSLDKTRNKSECFSNKMISSPTNINTNENVKLTFPSDNILTTVNKKKAKNIVKGNVFSKIEDFSEKNGFNDKNIKSYNIKKKKAKSILIKSNIFLQPKPIEINPLNRHLYHTRAYSVPLELNSEKIKRTKKLINNNYIFGNPVKQKIVKSCNKEYRKMKRFLTQKIKKDCLDEKLLNKVYRKSLEGKTIKINDNINQYIFKEFQKMKNLN